MFKKLLIANRGEIACRIIKTAKKMQISTVAVYSKIDEAALHVQLADESICIGDAASSESYLNGDKIILAAKTTAAEAVHPGYGFLSEDAEFAQRCQQQGITFVGPTEDAIRIMGDKNLAKVTMAAAGVPVVPGYQEDAIDLAALKKAIKKIGLPVLIKASAGGGGKGMRLVENIEQLEEALQSARREAEASFGDSRVFLEKYLARARHIEVQILFDQHGKGIYLFDRDCSIQRRHQKVIEEAPASQLRSVTRQRMAETALRAGTAIHYSSAGTIEFLVDENENFYFMEMNTRLQVEHPVTEMITGLDLVEWQLRIASGENLTLEQQSMTEKGHAIEARLYAENPRNNFMPSAGILRYFQLPPGRSPSVRIDSGFQPGDAVSIYYDPLLAKLIAWGENRTIAIETLQKMLDETAVTGIHTNWSLLNRILRHPEFINGNITTNFIAQHQSQLLPKISEPPAIVVMIACFALLRWQQKELQVLQQQSADPFSPWFKHDCWRLCQPAMTMISLWQSEKYRQISVDRTPENFKFSWDHQTLEASAQWRDDNNLSLYTGGQKFFAVTLLDENQLLVFCAGEQWEFFLKNPAGTFAHTSSEKDVAAPMPGTIVEIYVQPGQTVTAGERLLVMEAMKMEHSLVAPQAGKIQEIFYKPGDRVKEGARLLAFAGETGRG